MEKTAGLLGGVSTTMARRALKDAPGIGAAAGAVTGALSKDEQGNYGGVGGALKGAATGAGLGLGAKSLTKQLRNWDKKGLKLNNKASPAKAAETSVPKPSVSMHLSGNHPPQESTALQRKENWQPFIKKEGFAKGFQKTAGWKDVLKHPIGSLKGALQGAGDVVKEKTKGIQRAFEEHRQKGQMAQTQTRGAVAGPHAKVPSEIHTVPTEEAAKAEAKSKEKPSFMKKHPYLTAGGAALAYHSLTSQPQQQQQPQVYGPQY